MDLPPDAAELKALLRAPLPDDAKEKVLAGLNPEAHWVARLMAVRIAPRVDWPAEERDAVIDRLFQLREDGNGFVRPWALDSAWRLLPVGHPLHKQAEEWLAEALGQGSAAEKARARAIEREYAKRHRRVTGS